MAAAHSQRTTLLYRRDRALLAGVCAGLAEYLTLPPWLVRVVFIAVGLGATDDHIGGNNDRHFGFALGLGKYGGCSYSAGTGQPMTKICLRCRCA